MIEIVKIDNFNVNIRGRAGKYLSLVVRHQKGQKIIKELKNKIGRVGVNVAEVLETTLNGKSLSVFNLDGRRLTLQEVIDMERNTEGVDFIRSLSKLQTQ